MRRHRRCFTRLALRLPALLGDTFLVHSAPSPENRRNMRNESQKIHNVPQKGQRNNVWETEKSRYVKQDAKKGCKPFFFDRIDRLCRSGGAIFRSVAQKNHFRSLAMQDEFLHPAWSVSKRSFMTR